MQIDPAVAILALSFLGFGMETIKLGKEFLVDRRWQDITLPDENLAVDPEHEMGKVYHIQQQRRKWGKIETRWITIYPASGKRIRETYHLNRK